MQSIAQNLKSVNSRIAAAAERVGRDPAGITLVAVSNTLVQSIVPDGLRGRVMSLFSLVLLGMMPIGNLMVGALAGTVGTPLAVALSGAALGASILLLTGLRREILLL